MAFTVNRTDGMTKDAEFEAYARLLRQQGIDLGKLPRVPEPGTGNRWLYVWDSRQQADFRRGAKKTHSGQCLGCHRSRCAAVRRADRPIIVQVGRRAGGLVFGLHPLSRVMIKSAFPDTRGTATTVSINFETLQDFLTTHVSIEKLAREVVPTLTGLTLQELEKLGYARHRG